MNAYHAINKQHPHVSILGPMGICRNCGCIETDYIKTRTTIFNIKAELNKLVDKHKNCIKLPIKAGCNQDCISRVYTSEQG
jgi:hypothetical protein